MTRAEGERRRDGRAIWIVALVAILYATWLGAHWLRFTYSSGELPLYTSRLWDFESELARSGRIPWWSSVFMNGSSEALAYSGDLPLVPWALLHRFFEPAAAGKVLALSAIAGGSLALFACARRVLRDDTAAMVSAFAYLFHPLFLMRAAGTEHVSVVVFAALLPLGWLFWLRLLDRGRLIDVAACSLTFVAMFWSQNKQALVQAPFLAAFAAWSLARNPERRATTGRALAGLALLTLAMAAVLLVPALRETKLMKLFEGDPLEGWQRMYALHGLAALVDRRPGQLEYAGLVVLVLATVAALFGRERRARAMFWILVAFDAAALALGHGLDSIGGATFETWRTNAPAVRLELTVFVALALLALAVFTRRKLTTPRRRLVAALSLLGLLSVPWFRLLAIVPLFGDIRAPTVFWEVPGLFFGALLAGFFVTDVLPFTSLSTRRGAVVATLAALFLLDGWTFQRPMTASDVPETTLDRARALYAELGAEARREPGKVYVIGGRFFHLLGPSWGGPPLTTEPGLAFMAPRGSGRIAAAAGETLDLQRAYLDLVGVRWLVFDKSDPQSHTPGLDAQLAIYRKIFPIDHEDPDFVVFTVPTARPYISGYFHRAIAFGDASRLPELALLLAHRNYALEAAPDGAALETTPLADLAPYEAIYLSSAPAVSPPPDLASKIALVGGDQAQLPPKRVRQDPVADLAVARDSAQHLRAHFTAAVPCMAVVDESDYPFWRASLDGRPVSVKRVAYGLMGVPVGAGAHDLELTYEPPRSYAVSAAISLVACFAALALAGVDLWRRKKRPSQS